MSIISSFAPGLFTSERHARDLMGLRTDLTDLNRQLATGRKSETLGGLGAARTSVLDLRAHLSGIDAYSNAAERGNVRISLMSGALDRLQQLADIAKADAASPLPAQTVGAMNTAARTARTRLDEALSQLNTDMDGQSLFAGRASDVRPVRTAGQILDGMPGADGLKTLVSERRQADQGNGLGRLTLGQAGGTVTLAEEAAGLPFGFRIANVRSGLSGAAASGPTGSPAAISVAFTGAPQDGETLSVDLSLPDGTTETVDVVARNPPHPGSAGFAVDADPAATAANMRAALDSALRSKAREPLAGASAIVAARDMMAGSTNTPPQRIAGPPFATASGFVAPGARATVIWYQGDDASPDPRGSQISTIDRGVTLGVGAAANETGLRAVVTGLAVMAAENFVVGDANAQGRYRALADRSAAEFSPTGGQQIKDVSADLAMASAAMGAAKARHLQRNAILQSAISEIEQPKIEEISAALVALQTRLQASYQATASLGRLNLADYLR